MRSLQISDNDTFGHRFNGFDLSADLRAGGHPSDCLVWTKHSSDQHTHVLASQHPQRLAENLARNSDLASRVHVEATPITDRDGPIQFHFSKDVDSGVSSGSFVEGVETPISPSVYKHLGFATVTARSRTLDSLIPDLSEGPAPTLVKVDV